MLYPNIQTHLGTIFTRTGWDTLKEGDGGMGVIENQNVFGVKMNFDKKSFAIKMYASAFA